MRVGVLGAAGRMGSTVCAAVASDARFTLVAAIDPACDGTALTAVAPQLDSDLVIAGEIEELSRAGADVAVDFTVASRAFDNLRWCADNGVHAVCGTTGIPVEQIADLEGLFARKDGPNCVIAANFAISAVLMMRFSEIAAPYFDGAEIIELHHNEKKDAPSGTALETARRIVASRKGKPFADDPTVDVRAEGARGATEGGVHIHAVRLPGLVAHQAVLFGGPGQTLRIHQDSFERSSFMPGVLLASSKVAERPGLTIGLDALLDV